MPHKLFIFILLCCCCLRLSAQDSLKCQDVVYMKGGSIFRGTITQYEIAGTLTMTTWSGTKMQIPGNAVQKVVQDCNSARMREEKVYNFRERGWYHCSRAAMLFGEPDNGYSLQHSSGYRLNRFLSIGLGLGIENFSPGYTDPVIVPIYVETRGYLTRQRIAPFFAFGAGFSAIAKEQQAFDFWGWQNNIQNWKGGWMAQGQIGYRIGNHFLTYIGIRMQHLELDWDNSVWGGGTGKDIHTKKRIELGVGLLL